jgi:hypothetical protein
MLPRLLPEGPWRSSGELGDGGRTVVSSIAPSTKNLKKASTYSGGMVALICLRAASFESGSNARSRPMASLRTGD